MSEPSLRDAVAAALSEARTATGRACAANPTLSAALTLSRSLSAGEVSLAQVEETVRTLTAEAFAERAERLGRYLGETRPEQNAEALDAMFERLAEEAGEFEAFAARLARPSFGIVLTGHPTFALSRDLSLALVELATSFEAGGAPLDEAGRAQRLSIAAAGPHDPPDPLTLGVEHEWSVGALQNALRAVEQATRAALDVARRRWPDCWTTLRPRLLTLATWVGFDQDGRTDVTWLISVGKRLSLKLHGIARLRTLLDGIAPDATALLDAAAGVVERQAALLDAATADPAQLPAFARAMVEGRGPALVDLAPLSAALDRALADAPDDDARETLLAARAAVDTQGLSLAHIHVRLNAAALHTAVRDAVGLETKPGDPANRRTYFGKINDLIEAAEPQAINFGSLLEEPSSARRLMMTVAQMAKTIDPSPVRFLIAESESGFTLLSALYLATLFGVEDQVEISPLFETAEGFEAGEHLIEEALRSPAFRTHLERHGRLAIEFGFSDSGRFIGQMAATFRIERLRLRLADMLVRLGLSGLEVVFFNTHGESIGRGGHPGSLFDRYRYAAPPASRAEFARRGLALKEEESFQGGEGYLPLFTPAAALATVRTALESTLLADAEADDDPIYEDQDFASEFFATVQQAFSSLVADPNYPALLGLYGTRLLRKTGSRPEQRQSGDAGAAREIGSVAELRAIPNNGILQQLGWLANTLYGVGRAAAKDPARFADMRERSPRFRRALAMVAAAQQAGSLELTAAYAALLDPDAWMALAAKSSPAGRAVSERLSALAEEADLHGGLGEVLRRLERDALALADQAPPTEDARRARLMQAHALRIALMAYVDRLAAQIPAQQGAHPLNADGVASALMRFDVGWAVAQLNAAFPEHEPPGSPDADFGEPSSYVGGDHEHRRERAQLIAPIVEAHALVLQLTSAITHDVGACG